MPTPEHESLLTIAGACRATDQDQLKPLIDAVVTRHRSAVLGIIYYGSCFRRADPTSGLVDFYVVADGFRAASTHRCAAAAGRIIPPNVYYLEVETAETTLACKYALITRSQLAHGVERAFSSTLWGRLAQPIAIVYARNNPAHEELRAACGQAVLTLLERALPALGSGRTSPAHWFERALALSFASEIRVESGQREQVFIGERADEYARRFLAAMYFVSHRLRREPNGDVLLDTAATQTRLTRLVWWLRGVQGRGLSVLRLVKACFTFDGAVDYGAWKLARHTGYQAEITPRVRRHPLIFGWPVFWRALRAARRRNKTS
ncbi:hypothetical protein HKX42_07685 [Salinisphaera sp. USBA-960]|uniref:hypothetical protein n=1 Tax=Salinisphaera orenii TaxID=856731 RepID=UPI000DBE8364|nr:hypothetical protein [Salifodinibacter halophilus]NNC26752.1 hypothetical protein [Salifodinibacter halophilus]